MKRRDFILAAGGIALGTGWELLRPASLAAAPQADFSLRIAPVTVELGPGKTVHTIGYNGTSPGPMLRMKEGKQISVDVFNDTDVPELVHWHGQVVSAEVDGAEEEGTPFVPPRGQRRYTFTPRPAGTRWYHTHAMAADHLDRGTYTGQFGFLYIEGKTQPGRYDQEHFLAARQWVPSLAHKGPANNGWEMDYAFGSFNDKALGAGDPIRVKLGQRVLFHFLNASPTENLRLALPGHKFHVIAMDGNPVPTPASVEVLEIAVAERIDAVVEMNQPGVWVLGSARDEERNGGMGVVVEYAGRQGEPQWVPVERTTWDYTIFGSQVQSPEPDETILLTFKKIPGERVTFNHWTINDKEFPDVPPLLVQKGKRYRLVFHNENGDSHPLHLHRHNFEIRNIAGKPSSGIIKDIVNVARQSTAEVDFVADQTGLSLFHCHMQQHMDFGFKMLVKCT